MPINRIRLDDIDVRNLSNTTSILSKTINDLVNEVSIKANINSPGLTGTPTAPTATVDSNNQLIANTAFVINQGYLKSTTASSTYAPIASPTFSGTVNAGAALITNEVIENANVVASAIPSTANIDFSTSAIHFYTVAATNNWTFNFRGDSATQLNTVMATNQIITITVLVTNGTTPYRATAFQIDGANVTVRWADAFVPSAGNASSIDIYTFSIIKTSSNSYTVLGSLARFA